MAKLSCPLHRRRQTGTEHQNMLSRTVLPNSGRNLIRRKARGIIV